LDAALNKIIDELEVSAELMRATVSSDVPEIASKVAEAIYESLSNGGKLLLAGNGGSAADAQHIAAEFVNYFSFPRSPLAAIALTTDTSVITSISNDSSFDFLFARQVEALGRPGDVLWLYSTSGNSVNVVNAAIQGKKQGLLVVTFVGANGGKLAPYSDLQICIPSTSTPKIQEVHLVLGHAISGLVETRFFPSPTK
jgi:D-sedoheptulose 7-phosphate isomerase